MAVLSTQLRAQSIFKVRNDGFVHIGQGSPYDPSLTFGNAAFTGQYGAWALEYCSTCPTKGFNIWKPWPSTNYNNYFLFIRDNGNVGIGCDGAAGYTLKVQGNIGHYGIQHLSDVRLKKEIKPLLGGLKQLMSLNTYSYKYINQQDKVIGSDSLNVNILKKRLPTTNEVSDKVQFGFLAQDVQKIFPELVVADEHGLLSVDYDGLIPVLLNAVKEQNARIEKLEELILALKKQ
jgi:hypothetical protein